MHSSKVDSGYSVLRLVIDPLRGVSVPVGAIAWDAHRKWFNVRFLKQDEGISGVTVRQRQIVAFAGEQLRRWAQEERVPYEKASIHPWESRFWQAAADVLTSSVILDQPKAMEPLETEDELEALYEAVVLPAEPKKRSRHKIQGALNVALGPLANEVQTGVRLRAFAAREEKVMRAHVGIHGVVIVEAVNLAGRNARRDADALVSRLWRIFEGQGDRRIETVVGYRASPRGLNGESDMKAWMKEQLTDRVFDLTREADALREATRASLEAVGANRNIFE
jgi:hypothetical protein